ncbi:MAG: hypothetical protein JRF30_02385 [Deltaproteobacteria bacterium]|nr:hypothetical protein [Deltaproteobacteria bacterium]
MLNVRPVAFLILLCTIEGIWQDKVGGANMHEISVVAGTERISGVS